MAQLRQLMTMAVVWSPLNGQGQAARPPPAEDPPQQWRKQRVTSSSGSRAVAAVVEPLEAQVVPVAQRRAEATRWQALPARMAPQTTIVAGRGEVNAVQSFFASDSIRWEGSTIAGQSYPHLLFQLILSHSGWRYAEVAAGETFLALQQGLQNALWTLGGVPEVVRSDNTAAATHELRSSRGRALNDNYAALLDHYGLRSTRINPGQSHENGVAEHAHYRLKDAIDQALILRGSRDFDTVDDYASFVRQMVERRNRLVQGKLEQELLCLRSLPPAPVPEYVNYQSKVRKWCTIQVAGHSYSVPSRLIGKEVQIRLYADWVEVYYQGHLVERMERVRGEGEANVNYRHVIGSLVRKPGAFARYRFREQLFPTMHFRLTYDALRQWRGERADVEYVRILHLAATTMAATVDSALSLLLEAGQSFDYAEVRDLAEPKVPEAPVLTLVRPSLT